jgi:hypothetical protein
METFTDGEASLIVDDSHGALYIATWFGAPNDRVVTRYFDWFDRTVGRHLRDKAPFVLITDALDTARPTPSARKLIAERTDAMPAFGELNVGNYLVLSNPLVRGAITAMQWISRKPWTSVMVGTLQEALARGLGDLARAGARRPSLDAERYQRPKRPT